MVRFAVGAVHRQSTNSWTGMNIETARKISNDDDDEDDEREHDAQFFFEI